MLVYSLLAPLLHIYSFYSYYNQGQRKIADPPSTL